MNRRPQLLGESITKRKWTKTKGINIRNSKAIKLMCAWLKDNEGKQDFRGAGGAFQRNTSGFSQGLQPEVKGSFKKKV